MQPVIIYSDFTYNLPKDSRITVYGIKTAFKGKNVGVIAPHPDDTLTTTAIYLMARQDAIVTVFVATSGNHAPILGVPNPAKRTAIRQREAKVEAEALQLPEPEFLNLPFYEEGRPPNADDLKIMTQHLSKHPLDVLLLPAEGLYREGHPTTSPLLCLRWRHSKTIPERRKSSKDKSIRDIVLFTCFSIKSAFL